jgi:hypothetical protein
MSAFVCRLFGTPVFIRTGASDPLPAELQVCFDRENAEDALRGPNQAAAGLLSAAELDAALGVCLDAVGPDGKEHRMQELRVAWHFGLHENEAGEPIAGGVWFPDTPENRRDLTVVVEAGNEIAGEGTHWLEEREA